jgi:hypothetical protein
MHAGQRDILAKAGALKPGNPLASVAVAQLLMDSLMPR